jgi:hypothetical protein
LLFAVGCFTVPFNPVEPVQRATPIPYRASLTFPAETAAYTHSVRSWAAGIANSFQIRVGEQLQNYGHAYLDTAFLTGPELRIDIRVNDFDVAQFAAFIDATFTVQRSGNQVFQKQYVAKGGSYGGRTLLGGVFAMKSSMRRTTDDALRSLYEQFLADAGAAHTSW